jgi:hypothetical protein
MEAVLAVLGSLASIASLAIQTGVPMNSSGRPDFRSVLSRLRLTPRQAQTLKIEGAETIIELLIIDGDLLKASTESIKRCLERYKAALKQAADRRERERADKQAERCVCEWLNRIKQRNGGTLPEGKFNDWWQSYRCIDDFDY